MKLVWVEAAEHVAPGVPPVAGGAETPEGKLRWKCRSCGATMRHDEVRNQGIWRRRRPLSTWLFGGVL